MRQKRTYTHFERARLRHTQIESIDPQLDFGNGLTVADYGSKIADFHTQLDTYNATIADLDVQLTDLNAKEKALRDHSDRMLSAVAGRFGKNSPEYERAGGVRKDKKKRPTPKK